MEKKRRQFERIPITLEIVVESLSGKREFRLSDLSLGGCYVDSIASMTSGENINFKIRMPSGQWWQHSGKIAYVFPGSGFGISFNSLTEEDRILLKQGIEARTGQSLRHQDPAIETETKYEEEVTVKEKELFNPEWKSFSDLTQSIQEALEQDESIKKDK